MRALLIALAVLVASPVCAAEPQKAAKKLVCHIRGLEGDPAGSVEKGTVRALWEPHIATVQGEEAVYGAGGDNEVPGTSETIYGGVWVSITPTRVEKGKVTARIALEMTRLDDTDHESFVTSSGRVVRAVGTFDCGKPVKLVGQEKINGKQFWIEVTIEELGTVAPKASAVVPASLLRAVAPPKLKPSP